MVKVNRNQKENINSLLKRFSKKVRGSGKLHKARKAQYHEPKKSEFKQKEYALWKKKVRKIRDRLLKRGEIRRGQKIEPERLRKELEKLEE